MTLDLFWKDTGFNSDYLYGIKGSSDYCLYGIHYAPQIGSTSHPGWSFDAYFCNSNVSALCQLPFI